MLRVDGYVRVSRVGKRRGESFISPDVQRDRILSWAEARDAVVLRVFEELDESGSRADRPLLMEALRRIEEGASGGLVVSKANRFGRSLIDGLVMMERIRAAGGVFYSVEDSFDTGTDTGRLVLRFMLSMAEWDVDRARDDWATAKQRAVGRGVFICGTLPAGYRKTRSRRLLPDPRTAPVVAEVFGRRAAGESGSSLCRYLEERGIRTGYGNPCWTTSSLFHMLHSRLYLGELRAHGYVNEHAHPALVDAVTWEKAQAPRQLQVEGERTPVLLRGLVRCAACSMTLAVLRGPRRYYHCRRHFAGGDCPQPATVDAVDLEQYVTDAFFRVLSQRRQPPIARSAAAAAALTRAEAGLASYRDSDRVQRILGHDSYLAGLAARQERLRDARLAVADLRARTASHDIPAVAEVRRLWPDLDTIQRRVLISQVIDCVFVSRGRKRLPERVTICPIGTAPKRLPRVGVRHNKLRTIKPRREWMNPAPRSRRR
jgi:DNA invertase Pin-like site-specific DNA recombinase